MAYTMKGSPFQRNFGIGSPAKQDKDWFAPDTRTDEEKEKGEKEFERVHGMTKEEFRKGHEEDDKKKRAEWEAKQAAKKPETP